MRCILTTALVLCLVATAWPATAQTLSAAERPTVAAVRLDEPGRITLDGRLNEDVWKHAMPANGFRQIDPLNGQPATERTEVRIVYTARALYLGVICFDSEPDKWLGYQRRRDEFLSSDDRFMWTIDTFLDERSGYFFEMNPSGLMGDSLMGNNIDNRQWDGIWNAHVERSDIGWTIEIELPFRSFNFNPESDTWGINFERTVRRKNEDSIWTGHQRNQGLRRMANAGRVTGIRNVTQGLGLDVKPYGLLASAASPARNNGTFDTTTNQGIDLFYSVTPGLRSMLTINTDFAQTEVDQRQVNLTRFNLFFPERRDFFLDGAPFYAFGSPLSGDLIVNPFFSRRIGLSAANTPQKIDFGTKLTGQYGNQDLGVMHVRTGDDAASGNISEDFTIARLRRRVLQQSYIGGIYTRRDARDDGVGARQTAGLDMRLATNRFRGNQNLEASAYYLATTRPDATSGNSFGVTAAAPNDRWNIQFGARQVDQDFDPAIGFVTRQGYRRYQPGIEFGPRPRGHRYIRRVSFAGYGDVQTDLQSDFLTQRVDLKLFDVLFHSQEQFSVTVIQDRERLDTDFRVAGSAIVLPRGAIYSGTRMRFQGQTANRRVIALSGSYENGYYYSGSRQSIAANLTIRARPGVIVYTTAEFSDLDLPEGTVRTTLYRVIGETQFSPWIALVNNFQYDNVSDVLGWQSRFRWIVRPGSDIYVVYTRNWRDDVGIGFNTIDQRIASKVLYTHRF